MTEKEFTDLANKHLTVLESYQLDKEGNKQFNIFGYKQLFEAINYTRCSTELPSRLEMNNQAKNEFEEMKLITNKVMFKHFRLGFSTCYNWMLYRLGK